MEAVNSWRSGSRIAHHRGMIVRTGPPDAISPPKHEQGVNRQRQSPLPKRGCWRSWEEGIRLNPGDVGRFTFKGEK